MTTPGAGGLPSSAAHQGVWTGPEPDRPHRVLLVEDDQQDAFLFERALERSGLPLAHVWVQDGEQALEHLRGCAAHELPDLVLLDLNMPLMSGHEVLAEIRADRALCRLPVIVMSTSNDAGQVELAYRHRANAYVCKPPRLAGLVDALRSIHAFWLCLAELPGPAA